MNSRLPMLRAAAPDGPVFLAAGRIEISGAAADPDQPTRRPTAAILAYAGGLMNVKGWGDVVIDLAGLEAGQSVPILADHRVELANVVGHGMPRIADGQLHVDATLSRANAAARALLDLAADGVPLQASVGVRPTRAEPARGGATIQANGQAIHSPRPFTVIRAGTLREVSILPIGADTHSRVTIAASAAGANPEEPNAMTFQEWLTANGFTEADLTEAQTATLKAAYTAAQAATPAAAPTPAPAPITAAAPVDPVADMRAAAATEAARIAAVRAACAGNGDIEAQAIRDGWTAERAELAILRAARAQAPAAHIHHGPDHSTTVIEAAVCRTLRMADLETSFSSQTLEAADRSFRGELGLQELLAIQARGNGWDGHAFRESELRTILKAAFSTVSLSSILSNSANKALLTAFNAVEATWQRIAAIGSVRNFLGHTRHRLTGDLAYAELGPAGEIKHGTLGEQTKTIQADTYARMLAITRQDIINDDLGALMAIPTRMGRGAAIAINRVFWAAFMDNSAFFTSGNSNYFDGAATVLQSSSLATAVKMFRNLTDPDGDPVGAEPKTLLVPPALEETADALFASTFVNTGGSSSKDKVPSSNTYAGKYRPAVSSYLENASYTGYSATAWYLLADPADIATIEIAFLNGRQTPVVESADADFDQLGIQIRGYHDFGVAQRDPAGGVKSKGAAA